MPFLVPTRTKSVVGLLAFAVGFAGLLTIVEAPESSVAGRAAWAVLGASVALLVVALTAREPGHACAFCRKPRRGVKVLVSSPTVSICDECIPLLMSILTAGANDGKPPQPWQRPIIDGLPRNCPLSVSRPLLEALIQDGKDPGALRQAASACVALHHGDLASEALQRIPERDRTVEDWLDLGVAYGDARRDAEAVAATVTAQNLDDGRCRPWCLNNLVWFKLRLQPDASREVREGWLRDLEEARRLLAEKQPAAWKEVTVLCYGTEAEVRRVLGDIQGAFRALAEAEKLGPLNGTRLLIRARVLAMGDPLLGRADAARALELLHPESSDARDARELLAKLDARPEPAVTSPR